MKRIYKNTTKLRIFINTSCKLTGCKKAFINFMKPDNSTVKYDAVIKDDETGVLFYDIKTAEELDLVGWWKIWPEVVFDDDTTAFGRAEKFFVYEPGTL